jgi:excisionase family DNA binding protein
VTAAAGLGVFGTRGSDLSLPVPVEGLGVSPAVLEAAVRVVAAALSQHQPTPAPPAAGERDGQLPPLLSPGQAGKLFGVSRQTVDRMVDDGELPSVVLREGGRQRMVRIPKLFVLSLLADLNKGRRVVSLKEYTAQWTASVTPPGSSAAPGKGEAW